MSRDYAPIELAAEPEIAVGGAKVVPAIRQFESNGRTSILEPRVMQVLVLLARQRNKVVTRDELVEACWDGRIVGEDAIQRAIAGVRELGRSSSAFAVETIRKVGYMLVPASDGTELVLPDEEVLRHPALAIAPFADRTGLPVNATFVESLVADVCAEMAAELGELYINVLAPSSVTTLPAPDRDPRAMGRALDVDYLLEGDVRPGAPDYMIALRLIDTATGAIVWSQAFDGNPAQSVEAMAKLVNEIARKTSAQIERIEIGHALRRPSQMNAWDAQRRALAYAARNTREACIASTVEARRGVSLAPGDANSHAFLAAVLARELIYLGYNQILDQEVVEAVRRAREIDPDNSGVLAGCANALADTGRLDDALLLAEQAIALNPDFASGTLIFGSILARMNRAEEALAQMDKMERLAPNSIWFYRSLIWRSTAWLRDDKPEAALDAADRAYRIGANVESLAQLLMSLALRDDRDRARVTIARSQGLDPAISLDIVVNTARQFNLGYSGLEACVAWIVEQWDVADHRETTRRHH